MKSKQEKTESNLPLKQDMILSLHEPTWTEPVFPWCHTPSPHFYLYPLWDQPKSSKCNPGNFWNMSVIIYWVLWQTRINWIRNGSPGRTAMYNVILPLTPKLPKLSNISSAIKLNMYQTYWLGCISGVICSD